MTDVHQTKQPRDLTTRAQRKALLTLKLCNPNHRFNKARAVRCSRKILNGRVANAKNDWSSSLRVAMPCDVLPFGHG